MHWRWLLFRALRIVVLAYLGLLIVLLLLENLLVYRPNKYDPAQAERTWNGNAFAAKECDDVWLTTKDGVKVHGWWLPNDQSKKAVLFLHGNGGNLSGRSETLRKVRDKVNASVLIVDYPGYGKSDGSPSEAACYQTADAAYDWLTSDKKIAAKDLILFGESLGGGVAVDLASRREHHALVLTKTFTSLPDVACNQFPYLPVRWLMRNRYDNLAKIKDCSKPIFISHGDIDTLIPFELGKRLYEAAPEPKEFMLLKDQDHNDRFPDDFFDTIKAFLDRTAK